MGLYVGCRAECGERAVWCGVCVLVEVRLRESDGDTLGRCLLLPYETYAPSITSLILGIKIKRRTRTWIKYAIMDSRTSSE